MKIAYVILVLLVYYNATHCGGVELGLFLHYVYLYEISYCNIIL